MLPRARERYNIVTGTNFSDNGNGFFSVTRLVIALQLAELWTSYEIIIQALLFCVQTLRDILRDDFEDCFPVKHLRVILAKIIVSLHLKRLLILSIPSSYLITSTNLITYNILTIYL